MSVKYLPGTWTDVCVLPDGRFAQVTTDGPTVRCFVEGVLLWQRDAPIALGQCRAAYTAQGVLSIHQGNKEGDPDDGVAFLVGEHSVTRLGKTFGVQPVAIDSQFVYVVRSNQTYDRIALATGEVEHLPHGVPGSSQGFRDVGVWADNAQVRTRHGLTLHQFSEVNEITIGQADPPQIAGELETEDVLFTAFLGEAYEPHGAFSNGRYAIVARTPKGAAFVVVPPFPAFVSGAPAPIPVPVPQPKPEEPKPVSIPNLLVGVQRIRVRYPTPLGVLHPLFLIEVAQATGAKLLRKDGGTHVTLPTGVNVSQDILMFGDQGIDILSDGEGAAVPTWQEKGQILGEYIDVTNLRTNDPPEPAQPPTGQPVTPDKLADRLKAVEDAVAAIEAANSAERTAVAALGEALKALNEKPAPKYRATGTTSRDFGHSHRLNVTLEAL